MNQTRINYPKTCHYCHEKAKKLTRDHIYPISKIKQCVNNNIPLPENFDFHNNIVLACGICNHLKGNTNYNDFIGLGIVKIRQMKREFLEKKTTKTKIKF